MPPEENKDAIQFWELLATSVIENCAIIFAIAYFPLREAFDIQDRNAFGWGGIIVLWRLFTIPFDQAGGVVANGGHEGK